MIENGKIRIIIDRSQPGSRIQTEIGRLLSGWKYMGHDVCPDPVGNIFIRFKSESLVFHCDNVTDLARAFIMAGGVPSWYIIVLEDLHSWLHKCKDVEYIHDGWSRTTRVTETITRVAETIKLLTKDYEKFYGEVIAYEVANEMAG